MQRVWIAVLAAITAAAVPASGADPDKLNDSKQIVSHIPRHAVQSSAIAAVGYSKRRHILEIEFVNGAIYRYLDVPSAVHRDLMSAESKAGFYDSKIRRHYSSVLVQPRQTSQFGN